MKKLILGILIILTLIILTVVFIIIENSNNKIETSVVGNNEGNNNKKRPLETKKKNKTEENNKKEEWSANLVLELNTQKEALLERIGKSKDKMEKPAIVYSKPDENSEIKAKEDINIWKGWLENKPEKEQLGRPDPFGLPPTFPRYYILKKLDNQWYKVIYLNSQKLNYKNIKDKLQNIIDKINTRELVFIVDATKGMEEELEALKEYLLNLSKNLGKSSYKDIKINLNINKIKSLEKILKNIIKIIEKYPIKEDLKDFHTYLINLSQNLDKLTYEDIKISLILYQQIDADNNKIPFNTKILFKNISLLKESQKIKESINKFLKEDNFKGSEEALHDGIKRVLNEKDLFTPYSRRILIIITDEPGASGYDEQREVFKELPIPSLEIKNILGIKTKEEYTKIYGIYTGNEWDYNKFKKNLNLLTDINRNIFLIKNFSKSKYKEYKKILDKIIKKAVKEKLKLIEDLLNQIYIEGYARKRQKNHKYDTYRERILLKESDIKVLGEKVYKLSEWIEEVLHNIKESNKNLKQIILMSLVKGILKVTDNKKILKNKNNFEKLKKIICEEYKNKTLKELLNIKKNIPINPKGLLKMEIKEILELKLQDLLKYNNEMNYKAKCLINILNNLTTPINPKDINKWKPRRKLWFFTHKISGIKYSYIPINYIP